MRAVNLIPAEQRSGAGGLAGRSGGAAYVLIGVVAGLAVMAVLYGTALHEASSRQAEASTLSAEAAKANAEAERLAPYTKFVTLRDERVKAVQQLANSRFDWAHSMHELGRVLPSDVSLTSVSGTMSGGAAASTAAPPAPGSTAVSVTSATPEGAVPTFTLSGCTTSQSEVALTMDRLRLMDGVKEVSLQGSSNSSGSGSSGSAANACTDTFSMTIAYEGLPSPQNPPARPKPRRRTAADAAHAGNSAKAAGEGDATAPKAHAAQTTHAARSGK